MPEIGPGFFRNVPRVILCSLQNGDSSLGYDGLRLVLSTVDVLQIDDDNFYQRSQAGDFRVGSLRWRVKRRPPRAFCYRPSPKMIRVRMVHQPFLAVMLK